MKVKGEYKLPTEAEEPIRRTALKQVGAVTILVCLIVISILVTAGRISQQLSLLRDVLGAMALLLVIRQYSLTTAVQRLLLARDYRKHNHPDKVLAALLPYTRTGLFTTRTQFDRTGEAHYLLGWAAKQCGEDEVLAYCKLFLSKFRKGEWAKKARKL